MYDDLANWWHLISAPEDYAEEAAFFLQIISDAGLAHPTTLLELGSGGGNNATHLKGTFASVTLTDLSSEMLEVSRRINPECSHIQGDMRSMRLDRLYDVVFVHDAIDYMTTLDDLEKAIATAFIHCKPGGLALFVPDHVSETFEPSTDHGGHDSADRSIRYLEWSYDPDGNDTMYTVEYVYILREGNNPVRVEHEQHICGLFHREEWLRLIEKVGFRAEVIRDNYKRDIFLVRKP